MDFDKNTWKKISSFLNREMSVTLLFWIFVFLIVVILRAFGLV
jgi:hypothetical protein